MISNIWMRYAQNGGLKLVGNRNSVTQALFEDMTWLASLDFPPLELGFGFANPTAAAVLGRSCVHAGYTNCYEWYTGYTVSRGISDEKWDRQLGRTYRYQIPICMPKSHAFVDTRKTNY